MCHGSKQVLLAIIIRVCPCDSVAKNLRNILTTLAEVESMLQIQFDLTGRWCLVLAMLLTLSATPLVTVASAEESGVSDEARQFWAFKPVKRFSPPTVQDRTWPRNAVDEFVLGKLESRGLRPAPVATKAVLIRRVYL